MKVILPKTLLSQENTALPLFFLAGPINGARDWQKEACMLLSERLNYFYAAVPRRYERNSGLMWDNRAAGNPDGFERQLNWERHYLEVAARPQLGHKGCLIFWLERESETEPRKDGNPYAMDTRGELGEWRGRMMFDHSVRVVIGSDPNFPGLSQIKRNFNEALRTDFPIYPSLQDTIAAAVRKAA